MHYERPRLLYSSQTVCVGNCMHGIEGSMSLSDRDCQQNQNQDSWVKNLADGITTSSQARPSNIELSISNHCDQSMLVATMASAACMPSLPHLPIRCVCTVK